MTRCFTVRVAASFRRALAAAGVVLFVAACGVPGSEGLARELEGRGRLALLGGDDLRALAGTRAELVHVGTDARLSAALGAGDAGEVVRALREAGFNGLVVDGRRAGSGEGATVGERLARYAHVPPLRAVHLTPVAALYVYDERAEVPTVHGQVLARVARAVIGGAPAPRLGSFPESLRRLRNVEVMVLLRKGDKPRLWRSSRGSTVGAALLTAARVARQRWQEREGAMGGPLDKMLASLDVEVILLEEDGTIATRSPAFIERVFTRDHAVAYERQGTWRYQLPRSVGGEVQGSAVRAYEQLFTDHSLPKTSLERGDTRLYRLCARRIGISRAESAAD